MKRILAFALAVLCCAVLTACGESDQPTQSEQSAHPDTTQSANVQNDAVVSSGDATEATEPEDEFIPTPTEDLTCKKMDHPDGSQENIYRDMDLRSEYWGMILRGVRTYPDGTVEDISYYPGTVFAKVRITTNPDGSSQEVHHLPNGTYTDGVLRYGTDIYVRLRNPDGRESESFHDENGNPTLSILREADGSVETTTYDGEGGYCTVGTYPDGSSMECRGKLSGLSVFYARQDADGSSVEIHYDDRGREIYQCQKDADRTETGVYFDENGNMIRQYVRNPDGTCQEGILENGEWVWTSGTVEETQEDE